MILSPRQDPMGAAVRDYFHTGTARTLRVLSSMFDDDEMPLDHLFRSESQMPPLEHLALSLARGRVLDVGAGSGCHALALQHRGMCVTAIDISPLCVATQRDRGVVDARLADFFTDDFGSGFDTIIMLMNGIGICGGLNELPAFFRRLDTLLAPGGCLLTDSCDLRYIYADDNGHLDLSEVEEYYGEVDYQLEYGALRGPVFNWLYLDFHTLSAAALAAGYRAELLREGEHHDYLARIMRLSDRPSAFV